MRTEVGEVAREVACAVEVDRREMTGADEMTLKETLIGLATTSAVVVGAEVQEVEVVVGEASTIGMTIVETTSPVLHLTTSARPLPAHLVLLQDHSMDLLHPKNP